MHVYIEMWNAHSGWLALSKEERAGFMERLGPALGELFAAGIELVGFAHNEENTAHRANYRYIAVWKMPDAGLVRRLEAAVEQSGWHDYFEQVNASGAILPPEEVLKDMVNL